MSENTAGPIRFIIIDDDPISNLLCRISIKKYCDDPEIVMFTFADKAFDFIVSEYSETQNHHQVIVFLDINMPIWSGWDFLDSFEKLNDELKSQFKIYMMSSSIDDSDKLRAATNKNVIDYIIKPFNKTCLLHIFGQ